MFALHVVHETATKIYVIVHNCSFCLLIGSLEILSEEFSSVGKIPDRAKKGGNDQATFFVEKEEKITAHLLQMEKINTDSTC